MLNPLSFISKIFRSNNDIELSRFKKILEKINSLENDVANLKDSDFPIKTDELKNKIKNGKTKHILREACKNFMPEKIYNRTDKIGFEVASKKWITSKQNNKILNDYVDKLIENSKGILNDTALDYIKKSSNLEISFNDIVYRFIFFSIWMKIFKVSIKN